MRARLLLLSSLIATLGFADVTRRFPTVTDEIPVSQPQERPAAGQQSSPLVASNGNEFLVAWADAKGFRRDLYAARVTRAGELRDRRGIHLVEKVGQPLGLVPVGDSYFLMWSATENILGAELRSDGTLSQPRILVDGVTTGQAVASDGAKILLAYAKDGFLFRALLDSTGERLTRDIAITRPFVGTPGVAVDSAGFVVFWGERLTAGMSPPPPMGPFQTKFRALRIDFSGNLVTPEPVEIATGGETGPPVIVNSGDRLLMAWMERRWPRGTGRIALIDPATLRPVEPPRAIAEIAELVDLQLAAGWNGAQLVIAWSEVASLQPYSSRIVTLRLDSSGVPLDSSPVTLMEGGGSAPSLAWNGRNFFAAWTAGSDVRGAVLRPDASLAQSDFPIPLSATVQEVPAIASNGNTVVVTWREVFDDVGTSVVYAAPFPGGTPVPVSTTGSPSQHFPVIAAGRTTYLVVWIDGVGYDTQAIMGRLLDSHGSPIGNPIIFGPDRFWPVAIASNGENFLVVRSAGGRIVGQRVSDQGEGELLDVQPFLISEKGFLPDVASNGRDYLVAWSIGGLYCPLPPCPPPPDLVGARVSSSGAVLDPAPIPIATGDDNPFGPAVASNGDEYLVVYSNSYELKSLVEAKRVSRNGLLLGSTSVGRGLVISSGDHGKRNLAASWDGRGWLVVWEDSRSPGGNDDLFASYLSADLETVSGEFVVAGSPTHEGEPDLATVGAGRIALVYGRIAAEFEYVQRGFVRYIGSLPRSRAARR